VWIPPLAHEKEHMACREIEIGAQFALGENGQIAMLVRLGAQIVSVRIVSMFHHGILCRDR
jgi:hypothetical protein